MPVLPVRALDEQFSRRASAAAVSAAAVVTKPVARVRRTMAASRGPQVLYCAHKWLSQLSALLAKSGLHHYVLWLELKLASGM